MSMLIESSLRASTYPATLHVIERSNPAKQKSNQCPQWSYVLYERAGKTLRSSMGYCAAAPQGLAGHGVWVYAEGEDRLRWPMFENLAHVSHWAANAVVPSCNDIYACGKDQPPCGLAQDRNFLDIDKGRNHENELDIPLVPVPVSVPVPSCDKEAG